MHSNFYRASAWRARYFVTNSVRLSNVALCLNNYTIMSSNFFCRLVEPAPKFFQFPVRTVNNILTRMDLNLSGFEEEKNCQLPIQSIDMTCTT